MTYKVKVKQTETPFSAMINFLSKAVKRGTLIEIKPYFRFQIRFTAEDYHNSLSDEHKAILAEHAEKHSMALCNHYVYNYLAEESFTVYANEKRIIYDEYYENERDEETIFFKTSEFPQLISDNARKQHSKKFVVREERRE